MNNSPLVCYTRKSPNCTSPRKNRIDKITIHHMAGDFSVEACGQGFANPERNASANYGIGTDGRIALYVDESNRAFTSSNGANDHRAVTIEVANDRLGGDWHVSDKALYATIALCTDIYKRNGIRRLNFTGDASGNLTMHKWFAETLCPGPYLESKFPYIAQAVNNRLEEGDNMDGTQILKALSPEQCYELVTTAQKFAETLPPPEWAKRELEEAKRLGITDGETPMELVPRYQAAVMAYRARKDKAL